MCGIFLSMLSPNQTLHTEQSRDVTGLPTVHDIQAWSIFDDARLDGYFTDDYLADYDQMTIRYRAWWHSLGQVWWNAPAFDHMRNLWALLGTIRYGRIVYSPHTGDGWFEYRHRKNLFLQRLHPIGTIQWGQMTTADHHVVSAQMIIEDSGYPFRCCCCSFGFDLNANNDQVSEVQSLAVCVLRAVFEVMQHTTVDDMLFIEIDEDYGEDIGYAYL